MRRKYLKLILGVKYLSNGKSQNNNKTMINCAAVQFTLGNIWITDI